MAIIVVAAIALAAGDLALVPRSEHPWEHAGISKRAWRSLLHRVTEAYLPYANAALRGRGSDEDAVLALTAHQDMQDTLTGNRARISALLAKHGVRSSRTDDAAERRTA